MSDDLKQAIKEVLEEAGITKAPAKKENADAVITITKNPEDALLESRRGEWGSLSEFALDVVRADKKGGHFTERMKKWHSAAMKVEGAEMRAATTGHMEESELATGGYLVPEEFRAELQIQAIENSIVRSRATKIPMATNRISVPVVDVSSHASNFFGGVTVYRPDEAATITASRPKLGRVALNLHKLTGLVYVTDEILDDSPISLEPLLKSMFGSAIAFVEDDDYIQGNGSGQPLGAFNSSNPAIINVTRDTGSEINYQDIVNMWSRCHPSCLGNSVWLAHIDTFPQLATMSLAVGTGGAPVWLPAGAAAVSPFGTLMGKPLILTEKMATMGSAGDIGLVDFSQYWVGDKQGSNLKTASSIHVSFATDEVAFRFTMRYDGAPSWLNALTPRRGANTLSPFISLAA
ncbi:phage major capsid protein [Candidatus Pacearchaeota archaeon]|nr:phage major capsid protein [Candidatus Pacearchaeota archaeon]|tara:strand:- start:1034 stop:2251 length:1218 start_codon:yes stop_codon:yes gene_type:complete